MVNETDKLHVTHAQVLLKSYGCCLGLF